MSLNDAKSRFGFMRKNLPALWAFEGFFKLLIIVFAVPLLNAIQGFTMWAAGYSYLTAENIRGFLLHPLTILSFLLLLAIVFIFLLLDLCAVTYQLHNGWHGIHTDLKGTLFFSLRETADIIRNEKKIRLILVLAVYLPVVLIGVYPAVFGNLLLQELVVNNIRHRRWAVLLMAAFVLFMIFMFFRYMYTCHIRILEKCSLEEAVKRSIALGRRRHLSDALWFAGTQLICYLLYAVFLGLAVLTAFFTEKLLGNSSLINPVSTSVVLTVTTIALIFLVSLIFPVGCMCIAGLYYSHRTADGDPVPGPEATRQESIRLPDPFERILRIFTYLILLAAVTACGFYVFLTYKGRFNPNIEYLHTMEVTAHRGASRFYPENTMSAFREAADLGTDWIELDIHQSRDGKLYVMHDADLFRTCGVRGYGWNYTWEELSRLDAGKKFGNVFAGEPVPLLEEVIDFALDRQIRLNIELKPSVQETGMEENLVRLLEEKDFLDMCVVTSQKYSSIRAIKELNENIHTVYVMGYAFGNLKKLSAADSFSINEGSITRRLVSHIHNAGKQIYAWTANSRVNIESMIEKQVDNIITDDVRLAKKIIAEKTTGSALHEYLTWLWKWFG